MSVSVLVMALMSLGQQGAAVTLLQPHESSAVNDPLVRDAWLEMSGESWLLRMKAEFANVCLADGGIDVNYFDLADFSQAKGAQERLIMVRQRLVPGGCPDIFRPVTHSFAANLPKDRIQKQWLLTDTTQAGVRVLGINPTVGPGSSADAREYQLVKAQRLPDLPELTNVQVSSKAMHDWSGLQYSLQFEFACGDPQSAKVNILESRTGMSDLNGRPVIDWMWIQKRNKDTCVDTTSTEKIKCRFEMRRVLRADYARRLILINPTGQESTLGPFTVYDIWPKNGT